MESRTKNNNLTAVMDSLNIHESEDQLIIGLDFGTTFSGIAYAFTKSSKPDLVSILDWPGTCLGSMPIKAQD